jgi:hypothetical protein
MKKIFAFVVLSVLVLSGCRIENPTYPFRVKVTNAQGVPIQNVVVEASVDVPGYREEAYFIDTTGFDGVVEFQYDYEAVFKILGTRGENPFTHIGCGFIKLEPNKTVETKIILLPYDPSDPGC